LGLTVTITVTATDDGVPPAIGVQSFTLDVAANPHPWQNPVQALDTNNDEPDHAVVSLDALIIFNLLNNPSSLIDASSRLPVARPAGSDLPFYDTSGDGFCTSLDALLIINDLNNRPIGEGEALAAAAATAPSAANDPPALERLLALLADDVTHVTRFRRRPAR
jgi:hypothetical protein